MGLTHGEILEKARISKKISKTELGRMMGVDRQSIYNTIDEKKFRRAKIAIVVKILGLDPSSFGCSFSDFNTKFSQQADFSGVRLDKAELNDRYLVGTNFSRGKHYNCNYNFSSLQCADFSNAYFEDCTFINANLSNANLKYTTFNKCTLIDTCLQGCKVYHTDFSRSVINYSTLLETSDYRDCFVIKTLIEGLPNSDQDFFKWAELGQASFDRENYEERIKEDDVMH